MAPWVIKATFTLPPSEVALDRILDGFLDQATAVNLIATGSCDNTGVKFTLWRDGSDDTIQNEIATLVVWLQLQSEVSSVSSKCG